MGILPDDVLSNLHGSLTPEEAAAIVEKTKLVPPGAVDDALIAVSAALAARTAGVAAVDTVLAIAKAIAQIGLKLI